MAESLRGGLIRDLESLHDDHATADLEFVTGGSAGGGGGKLERIRAHRLIVLFRCRRYWSKKQQWLAADLPMVTVRLEWTEPDTARRVVRYLYTGQVDCGQSSESLIQTIVAALEFGLPELKEHCLERLIDGITADSVCSILITASSSLGSVAEESGVVQEIERACVEYIESNTRSVFKSKGFLQLPKETLLSIIQSSKSGRVAQDIGRAAVGYHLPLSSHPCMLSLIVQSALRELREGGGYLGMRLDIPSARASRNSKQLHMSRNVSAQLTASEEDVWRAVLAWGHSKAGVQGSVKQWTDTDRAKMKQVLNGVLEHVRLMEIGSEVFAQEVEPTGLLSMEMTLARYRHAAVHGKGLSPAEKQSRPRSGCPEAFIGSELLAERADFQMQINEWCGTPSQEWVLLYRASRDGFQARKFHAACDEKGATVVVVKTPSGCVFGGYTDVSWSSRFKRGKFASSTTSFLFSLTNTSGGAPAKFEIKQSAYAINNHPGNGPIFGSGADLCISNECNRNKDSYSQLPYTYGDMDLPNYLLTGEHYFSVEDYEVFGLAR